MKYVKTLLTNNKMKIMAKTNNKIIYIRIDNKIFYTKKDFIKSYSLNKVKDLLTVEELIRLI